MAGRTPEDMDDLWALADKNGGVLTREHFEFLGGEQRFGTFKNVRRRFSAREEPSWPRRGCVPLLGSSRRLQPPDGLLDGATARSREL